MFIAYASGDYSGGGGGSGGGGSYAQYSMPPPSMASGDNNYGGGQQGGYGQPSYGGQNPGQNWQQGSGEVIFLASESSPVLMLFRFFCFGH